MLFKTPASFQEGWGGYRKVSPTGLGPEQGLGRGCEERGLGGLKPPPEPEASVGWSRRDVLPGEKGPVGSPEQR